LSPSSSAEQIRVLVTAVGGVGFGEQILKALRIAGGYSIIGADANGKCANFGLVDEAVQLPLASAPEYIDAVKAVCAARDVHAVFFGCEPELRRASKDRDALAEAGVFVPIDTADVIAIGMDKLATSRFLDEHRFARPRAWHLEPGELPDVDRFPVVLKPAVGGGGSADCYLAQTPRELELYVQLLGQRRTGMMVQEYVGTPEHEYTVGVLHDMDGTFVNSIALRRELDGPLSIRFQAPNATGREELGERLVISSGFSHGVIDRFPEVTEQCERIAAELGVHGAVNIQCRLVDGVVQVFEINPRFSGTTSLRALVGYNEPHILLQRNLRGAPLVPRFPYATGRIQRSLTETLLDGPPATPWSDLRAPTTGPRSDT
jgi:carbamoyl-phosphate synthase large subunit